MSAVTSFLPEFKLRIFYLCVKLHFFLPGLQTLLLLPFAFVQLHPFNLISNSADTSFYLCVQLHPFYLEFTSFNLCVQLHPFYLGFKLCEYSLLSLYAVTSFLTGLQTLQILPFTFGCSYILFTWTSNFADTPFCLCMQLYPFYLTSNSVDTSFYLALCVQLHTLYLTSNSACRYFLLTL